MCGLCFVFAAAGLIGVVVAFVAGKCSCGVQPKSEEVESKSEENESGSENN